MNYVTSNFFEFKGYQVQKIKKTEQSITVFLSPRRKTAICPNCETKSKSLFSKDGNRRLKHSKYESRIVELSLPRRRFYCKRCSKPFAETPEFANPKARTTKNFALEAVHALSKSSFSTVCQSYRVSHSFLTNSLKRLDLEIPWPKGELRLGFDEHAYAKRKMMITVTDLNTRTLLAILPTYSRQAVTDYLDTKTKKELSRVVELCFDMQFQQRAVVQEYFPNIPVAIDKFHVLARFAHLIDLDRKSICPGFGRGKFENLKRTMRKPVYRLKAKEKNYLNKVFLKYPKLKTRWNIYQKLVQFYNSNSKNEGRVRLEEVRGAIRQLDRFSYLRPFEKTLTKLEEDILNYFNNRTTNAFTEGVHTKIKLLKRTSYGFKNPDTYIKKMLLAFLPFVALSMFLPH